MLTQAQFDGYKEMRAAWREDPALYARVRLGMNPSHQQLQLLNAVKPKGAKVTCRAGHGVGKSGALAAIVLWALECLDGAKIPCTAPSAAQLRDVLWAEIAKWMSNSDLLSEVRGMPRALWLGSLLDLTQDRVVAANMPHECFAVARTARPENPSALQGMHASSMTLSEDGYSVVEEGSGGELIFVIDEAAGVHDNIYHVAEGALSSKGSRLIMTGNPTVGVGYFAESHKRNRSAYTCLHFKSSDSPLVEPGYREGLVRKFGEGSNIVRVRADGDFPLTDDNVLIGIGLTEPCLTRDPYHDRGAAKILGVDVARFGDDRTVCILRQGRDLLNIAVRSKQSTMQTVGDIINFARAWDVDAINVDEIGVGAGVVDRLKELHEQSEIRGVVCGVNVANKADERSSFSFNDAQGLRLRDSLWLHAHNFIRDEKPSFALAPKDYADDLVGELSSIQYKIDSSGRIVIESKDEAKRRGLRSPDLADAFNLTFASNIALVWTRLAA